MRRLSDRYRSQRALLGNSYQPLRATSTNLLTRRLTLQRRKPRLCCCEIEEAARASAPSGVTQGTTAYDVGQGAVARPIRLAPAGAGIARGDDKPGSSALPASPLWSLIACGIPRTTTMTLTKQRVQVTLNGANFQSSIGVDSSSASASSRESCTPAAVLCSSSTTWFLSRVSSAIRCAT